MRRVLGLGRPAGARGEACEGRVSRTRGKGTQLREEVERQVQPCAGRGADAPTGHARPGRIPTRASHRVTRDRLVRRALVARVTSWRVQPWPHRLEECLKQPQPRPCVSSLAWFVRLTQNTRPISCPPRWPFFWHAFLPTFVILIPFDAPPPLSPLPTRSSVHAVSA